MTDGSEGGGTVHEGTQNGWPALVIDGENAAVSSTTQRPPPSLTFVMLRKNLSSLQCIHRFSKRLPVRLDVAPDIAVGLVAGGLLGVLHALGLGELAQERMPQHVW